MSAAFVCRSLAASVAGAVLFVAAHGMAATLSVRNPAETILIQWGHGDENIGLLQGEELERCGPLGFCVGIDGPQILDTVNARIVSASPGRAIRIAATGVRGTAIVQDGAGGLLVLEDKQICRYVAGRREETFSLPPKSRFVEGYGAAVVLSSRGVSAAGADQNNWLVAARAGNGRLVAAQVQNAARGTRGRPGNTTDKLVFEIKRLSGNEIRILGSDPDGKVLVAVPLQMGGDPPGAVIFKGQDSAGNLYVEVERLRAGRAELEVHRYARDGTCLAKFELNNDYYTTVYGKTEISADGSVWQLLTTPDGVRILRY